MKKILYLILLLCVFGCKKIDFGNPPVLVREDSILNNQSAYMIVLGDIQTYTMDAVNMPYLQNTISWIWSQKQYEKNISSILQVGDVTDCNSTQHWERFYDCTLPIAKEILYVTCVGNHDYDWDAEAKINDRKSTHINKYALFPLTSRSIVEYFEKGRMENIIVANTINGERCDILVLEFGPRVEVLKWADRYVSSHPDRKFILMTHEYLTRAGKRISEESYAELQLRNTTWTTPEQVWQQLVKNNDNIVCVLCGHNGFSAQLFSENSVGRKVPQILFNLQYQNNGGDGWIQLWEFPQQGDSVSVSVYNTITREFHPDPSTSFKFRYRY